MPTALEDRCRKLLLELAIAQPADTLHTVPLAGGVASDIAMVSIADQTLCVKFALPKLKVEADWFAPVHRNAAEYAWLQVAAEVAPESAITLYGQSPKLQGFAMEFLQGSDIYLWKNALLDQLPDRGEAGKVGDLLGRVHAASAQPDFDASAFLNHDDFYALRIEPYILHTASKHDDIAAQLKQIATQLYNSRQVLVHGDISPKNILFRSAGPVLLDAECATMGDASFDLAFCLNHLVLKAIHLPASADRYLASAVNLWQAYSLSINWEAVADAEARVCNLLPVLMLARVDGKSPVEYLSDSERATVRHIARQFIKSPVSHLHELVNAIGDISKERST